MGLTVILPCYNEDKAISQVLAELMSEKASIQDQLGLADLQILVIDDGSTDNSLQELEPFKSEISIHSFSKNKGYGAALIKGVELAKHQTVVFYDLDGTCHPRDIIPLYQKMKASGAKMVIGNRLTQQTHMPALRQFGNRLYVTLAKILFNNSVHDICSGFRMFDRQTILSLRDQLPADLSFTLSMTILFLINGLPLVEEDVEYTDRLGESKLSEVSDGLVFLGRIIGFKFSFKNSYRKQKARG